MKKLLIVDDDPDTLEFFCDFFTPRGCSVLTSTSCEEALKIFRLKNPDLILSDIKMGGKSGLYLLKEIKEFSQKTKVILVSVASDNQTLNEAKKLGADDFIRKPVNIQNLERIVCKQLYSIKES